jgi:hypothetical protein
MRNLSGDVNENTGFIYTCHITPYLLLNQKFTP